MSVGWEPVFLFCIEGEKNLIPYPPKTLWYLKQNLHILDSSSKAPRPGYRDQTVLREKRWVPCADGNHTPPKNKCCLLVFQTKNKPSVVYIL